MAAELLEQPRPGQVVAAELVEPFDGGRDLLRFILQPVEMGLPRVRIFTHHAPAFARLPAPRQPVRIALQFGGRGEPGPAILAGAVLQLSPLVQKPGRHAVKRNDLRMPRFACLRIGNRLFGRGA